MVEQFTDENFAEKVKEGITVVDFWAEWCGPCKMIAPIIEELSDSDEYADKVTFAKLDVDQNPEISMKYNIRSIPTILFFKDGEVVDSVVGAAPKSRLVSHLQKHI